MKNSVFIGNYCLTLIAIIRGLTFVANCQGIPGLPEPGYVMYGTVTNSNGNHAVPNPNVAWRVIAGNTVIVPPSTTVFVNGQAFYICRVPFETRSIPGAPSFAATPGTLELTDGASYVRSAVVNGTTAVLSAPATFSFGTADRGKVERVNLLVNLPAETFEQWAQRIFGVANVNRDADPDGDGASNFAEYQAGTDPLSKDSVFKFIDIFPAQPGGIGLRWSSVPGRFYQLERSVGDAGKFVGLIRGLPADGPIATYTDPDASGPGPYFYRLRTEL